MTSPLRAGRCGCTHCCGPSSWKFTSENIYDPDPDKLVWIDLNEEGDHPLKVKVIYADVPHCGGTGSYGQAGTAKIAVATTVEKTITIRANSLIWPGRGGVELLEADIRACTGEYINGVSVLHTGNDLDDCAVEIGETLQTFTLPHGSYILEISTNMAHTDLEYQQHPHGSYITVSFEGLKTTDICRTPTP